MVRPRRSGLPRQEIQRGSKRHHPRYEARTLARAFSEITGIRLRHDLLQEGDVVEKIQTQMQSGRNVYDAWVNDSDLIGTHFRYQQAVPLTDWMAGEGRDQTLPTLDMEDFIGRSFGTGPGRQAYQSMTSSLRPIWFPRLVHPPGDQGSFRKH